MDAAMQCVALRRQQVVAPSPRRSFDMSNLWRDLRLGLRTAWRSPGYSAVAIGTLALAIGANTLLFSIANPLIAKELPMKDPGTLGWIFEENKPNDVTRGSSSIPDFLEWRRNARSFSALAARETWGATITGHGSDAERLVILRVTANLDEVWGLTPSVGRLFQDGEDLPGSPRVAVLSNRFWRSRFSADRDVIGRVVWVDGVPTTIVGVMDPKFELFGNSTTDVWMPLPLDPNGARDARTLRIVGRLAPGVTVASANAEIAALSAAQARDHGGTNANWQATVLATRTAITSPDTWVLLGLLGVVVLFVLLIACVNLANLVLARVLRRRQDFAVRQALGASRLQLIRPLLAESLLLAIAGGLGGLALAQAGLRIINATAYDGLLRQIGIDGNVLIFAALVSLATPFLFSLWPALGAGRAATAETLRDARTSGGRPARRRRNVLVAAEVALAMSLLVISGLILQAMLYLERVDIGMNVQNVLTFRMEPTSSRYPDDAAKSAYVRNLVRDLTKIPGVEDAAVVSYLPVVEPEVARTLTGTLHDGDRDEARPVASWYSTTPDFFRVVGIKLVAGRGLAPSDIAGAEPVAVLNRMAAEKYFDTPEQALGHTVVLRGAGTSDRAVKIVGVVADTRNSNVVRTNPQVYVAFDQWPCPAWTTVLRSTTPADRTADARTVVRALDPGVAISLPKTLATLVDENTGDTGIVNGLFSGFALVALLLAAAGLYGVISHSVGQRQREFGVRLTLGAEPKAIRRMVVTESLRVTISGILVGLVLATLLAFASSSVLYGVSPWDPLTFGSVTLLVLIVSIVAVWSPASRAMKQDPASTLRAE
jgi:predicted permease